jgi:hypothetical protein
MNARKMTSIILVAMVALLFSACGTSTIPSDTNSDAGSVAGTETVIPVSVPASPILYPSLTSTPNVDSPTVPPIPTPSPTDAVLTDCFLSFKLAAWQDLDGDGQWGASEPPLEGVTFHLQGIFAEIWGYPYLSKADGRLTITTWSPGRCSKRNYTLTVFPPESYESTTPASVTFSLSPVDFFYEAQFGFRTVST